GRDGAGAGAAGTRPAAKAPPSRPRAKPPVRKLARDRGVDLSGLQGSGPEGIITREDVLAAAGNGQAGDRDATLVTDRAAAPGGDHATAVPASEDYQELLRQSAGRGAVEAPIPAAREGGRIPVRGVRKLIAEKMTRSRREIPEATTWVDADATALWELRQALNADQGDVKVSPLAIILRACVAGLRRFPQVNASLDTERNEIVLHDRVNLGFAAQTDRGLVVPVIKGAERMSTLEIAAELNRLATAARDGKVTPEEMMGGTFTVSNYGSFGVDGGSAVINHPEAAILGVGRISDRPWVLDGGLAVRKVTQLSIAFDHRICDGGEAAGFLRFMADCVERPALLLGSL
nr:2-oxo acid dehydrogenase subunit E2 [Euzebyales bacterium]